MQDCLFLWPKIDTLKLLLCFSHAAAANRGARGQLSFLRTQRQRKKVRRRFAVKRSMFSPSPLLTFYKPHSEAINFKKGCFSPLFWMKHWHHLEKYTFPMRGRPALLLKTAVDLSHGKWLCLYPDHSLPLWGSLRKAKSFLDSRRVKRKRM